MFCGKRVSGILVMQLVVAIIAMAAVDAGWFYTYKEDLYLLWEDTVRWYAMITR